MLAHKVDGKHPSSYSELLPAAQKWERWTEAKYPLLLKTTTTGGLNVNWLQTSGNWFPSRKLKGNHTFTAQSTIVESTEAEEDSNVKPEGEEEAESSAEEDAETSNGVRGADQLVGYIIHFANVVMLYQRKNQNCFRCGSPDQLMRDCSEGSQQDQPKSKLKQERGNGKEEMLGPSKTSSCSTADAR